MSAITTICAYPRLRSSSDNGAVQTLCSSCDRTHIDQAALVTDIESITAVAKDLSIGCAWPIVLADDLPVAALHARRHRPHVGVRG